VLPQSPSDSDFLPETLVAVGEIARDLAHPLAIGPSKDPGNIDSTSLEIDHEENEMSNRRVSDR
jgi:hypothetical protein